MRELTWQFISFLKEVYQDTQITEDTSETSANIRFLDLNLKELWGFLKMKWGLLDKSALSISDMIADYKNRKAQWDQILDDSKKLTDREFILKHSEYRVLLENQDKQGKLDEFSIETEKNVILVRQPPMALKIDEKYVQWNGQNIYCFKIYEKSPFRINLHIKHEKRYFHDILLFFTFSIENPKNETFSMEFINNYYLSLISMYEIINLLKSNNYNKASVKISDGNIDSDINTLMSYKKKPFLFKVYYLYMMHNSLGDMLELLSSHLEKIQERINKFTSIQKPAEYYSKFEEEVKLYLEKGKHLFLKSEDLFYKPKVIEQKVAKKPSKKPRLTEEKLIDVFQLENEMDVNLKVKAQDTGFRSLPEIFKLYKNRLNISWKTFNDKALLILEKSPKFEQRERNKVGGGKEYRISTEPKIDEYRETRSELRSEDLTQEDYEIIMLYEQAIIMHDDGQINNVIHLFKQILDIYGPELEAYSWIYCDVCQRLAAIYENLYILNDAEILYKNAMVNAALGNNLVYSYKIAGLKIAILRGNIEGLNEKILKLEQLISEKLEKNLLELNINYQYIEGTNIEDLDIVYIRDLKRDEEFTTNPTFQEVIQLDLDYLMIQLLKLDLLRRAILIESFKNFKNVPLEVDYNQNNTPLTQKLFKEADEILDRVYQNKFNWGNRNFILFGIYKTYFNNMRGGDRIWEEGFDYGMPDTYYPYYRTKYLFNITNYENLGIYRFFEPLTKEEFFYLDPENQVEYLVKLCGGSWIDSPFGTSSENVINIHKNMKTLIDYAVYLVEKHKLEHLKDYTKLTQEWVAKEVNDLIIAFEKRKNRRK